MLKPRNGILAAKYRDVVGRPSMLAVLLVMKWDTAGKYRDVVGRPSMLAVLLVGLYYRCTFLPCKVRGQPWCVPSLEGGPCLKIGICSIGRLSLLICIVF